MYTMLHTLSKDQNKQPHSIIESSSAQWLIEEKSNKVVTNMQKIFAFLSMYLVWFWQLLLPNMWTQESKKSNSSKEITDKIVKDMFEGIDAAPLADIPPVSISWFWFNKMTLKYYSKKSIVPSLKNNVSAVVEFQRWWVLKINIFGQELTYSKEFSLIESVHAGLSKSAWNHTFKVNIWCQKPSEVFQKKNHLTISIKETIF